MRNGNIGKVAVHSSMRKREKFNFSHDVNTTADFGDCQPLMCRMVQPNSKSKVGLESLVRLAPMLDPTFGRISYKSWHYFVRMSDLTRNFSALLSQTPVTRNNGTEFLPKDLPHMSIGELSTMVLFGSFCTIWQRKGGTASNVDIPDSGTNAVGYELPKDDNVTTVSAIMDGCLRNSDSNPAGRYVDFYSDTRYMGGYSGAKLDLAGLCGNYVGGNNGTRRIIVPLSNPTYHSFFDYRYSTNAPSDYNYSGLDVHPVPLDKADLVICVTLKDASNTDHSLAFAFRLSSYGKRLRKILLGLGYQIDFFNDTHLCVMPLLAYFKAYYDVFGLLLYENWENTACCKLLELYDQTNKCDWSDGFNYVSNPSTSVVDQALHKYWIEFLDDLSFTYVTDAQDWVSAHTRSIGVSPAMDQSFISSFMSTQNSPTSAVTVPSENTESSYSVNQQAFINRVFHGKLDEDLLKILAMNTNRNTIAGKRVIELCRLQGLGDFVDKMKPSFIGYDEVDINIRDVVSTSNTSFNPGEGSLLGEYGANGLGYKDGKTFTYENDELGYWVTIVAIVPLGGYCQAVDGSLFAYDKFGLYMPDFDGKGMEPTRKMQVVGAIDWNSSAQANKMKGAFGYMPRHSRYKWAPNIMNGDFNLRSTRDGYSPFTLDKIINVGERTFENDPSSASSGYSDFYWTCPTLQPQDFPVAGNIWRYTTRYQYLSRYRRIFANVGDLDNYWPNFMDGGAAMSAFWEWIHNMYDNFLIHNIVHFDCYSGMLPISDSFETLEDGNEGTISTNIAKA